MRLFTIAQNLFARFQEHRACLGSLLRNECGGFVVLFALSLVPIAMAGGAAVDMAHAVKVRNRLSHALDAAGLAAGTAIGRSAEERASIATSFFNANYPAEELGAPGTINVLIDGDAIKLSADAEVETTLLKLAGLDSLDVRAASEITIGQKHLEVVMVLDNTGSMGSNGKMDDLKKASSELVEILFGGQTTATHLRMALVPYVTAVNIKSPGVWSMDWLDQNAEAKWHGVNFENADGDYVHDPKQGPVNHFDLFNAIEETEWKGCVEARAEPYDTDDTAPNAGNPDTLFVPYFWPDEPDKMPGIANSYISMPKKFRNGNNHDQQADIEHYTGTKASIDEVPSSTQGPNKACARPILPLTNKKKDILDEIGAMEPHNNGGTNGSQGMIWGLRAISPTAPYTEGRDYNDPEVAKAIIMLTDGQNYMVQQSNSNDSDYNSYNYLSHQRLGTSSSSEAAKRINEKMAKACELAKKEGVTVYTIVFQLNDSDIETLFKKCASKPVYYFNSPSGEDLKLAFQTIASHLTSVRISR